MPQSEVSGVGSRESKGGAKAPVSDPRLPTPDPWPMPHDKESERGATASVSDSRPPTPDPQLPRLAPLQEWMQGIVTHPGDVYEAAAEAALDVDTVILPSATLQPIQRVGLYHGMYLLRMIEALAVDYGSVSHFLGEEAFETLVRAYVQRFPSRSYTLNRLGDSFPEFIAASTLKRRIFLRDLARLELAMTQVFEEAEAEALPADAIASVAPDRVADARITPIPALRLLSLDYDANEAFQAWRDERAIEPLRRKSRIAVHRREYSVYRMPLSHEAFTFLGALGAGRTIGEAIAVFHRRFKRLPKQDEIFTWFRDWSAAGLFAAIEVR
ncbi:MAG TPA: DNA-binding domain-containing protein [Thermoanaerobaculia bacterium]|nr:DNA-binding domain-containing protein [Thermoanaerobaculia bacterium]